MASDAANGMDDSTAQIRKPYATKDYLIKIHLTAADHASYANPKDWLLLIEFRCHDLLQIMREGLFWTTSNVVPEGGWLNGTKGNPAKCHSWTRVWELREFADR